MACAGGFRALLSGLKTYIATPRSAKHRIFTFVDARMVPDNAIVWFATESLITFGILHSRIHEVWTLRRCSYQGVADTPRYKHTDIFEPFPFPAGLLPHMSHDEQVVHPNGGRSKRPPPISSACARTGSPTLVKRIPEVVADYPDRIVPADAQAGSLLRDRTLTKLYNKRPAWLDNAHRDLDAAVAGAYGWPTDLTDEQILERLFALNQERAVRQGKK